MTELKSFIDLLVISFPMFLSGMGLTLELSVVSLFFAMFIGLLSSLMNIAKFRPLHWISQAYINIVRGTPLLVQAFFIYFGVTQALGIRMTAFVAGIIALSLNAGAYLSEIFRGGIQAVNPGQMEAARSLGMPYRTAMLRIILPQAIRIVVPSVVNQCIITIKDTSIISVIGLAELTMAGSQIIARTYRSFEIWVIVGILYFIIIYALTKLSKFVEKRLSSVKSGNPESA
jgi:His/Glu/Gln/Arg/opine family amino acid ABC transporter permease subunit